MKPSDTKACIPFKSAKNNNYFYDRKLKKTILCHPLFFSLVTLHEKGTEPGEWLNKQTNDSVEIENVGSFSKEDIEYYYRKYLILRDNGHFGTFQQEETLKAIMTADRVKASLANSNQLTFELVDYCNIECTYCGYGKFYKDYDKRENKKLSLPAARRFLDYMVELRNSSLNISHNQNFNIGFYGGEPLLNFSFIRDMVNYTKKIKLNHNRFGFSMTTNGLLLKKYMDFLVAHDFKLLISLDGNEKNNRYRVHKDGTQAYNEILENVSALQTKYPDYFEKRVNFNAVLHNKNSVSEIFNYFKMKFGKIPRIGVLSSSGIRESQKEEFLKTYSNVYKSLYSSNDYRVIEKEMFVQLPNIQDVSTFLHHSNDFSFANYNQLLYDFVEKPRFPTGTCLPFGKKIYVTVKGKIMACERIAHRYGLGFIDSEAVKIDFDAIAKQYNMYYDTLRNLCRRCYKVAHCTRCLFIMDLTAKKLHCNEFHDSNDFAGYLSGHLNFLEKKPEMYNKIFKEIVIT
ncbi:MAG: radical SAM peptide maturase [bacterium]|nr:radical SAM peptide maturase [bacterium]